MVGDIFGESVLAERFCAQLAWRERPRSDTS